MRKIIIAAFLPFFMTQVYSQNLSATQIADKGKGIPVEIKDNTRKDVFSENKKEGALLKNYVSTYIRQNISSYTNFEIIDSENTKLYFEDMRKKESAIYTEADSPSLGNFRSGQYFFNYTLSIRDEIRLNLTIEFTHIQSGTLLATNTDSFTQEQIKNGVAIGTVLLNVFEKLKFTFTDIQKKEMLGIAFDISELQAQIASYTEQIKVLHTTKAKDNDFIIETQIKRLSAEIQRLQQNIETKRQNDETAALIKETQEKQKALQNQQSEELKQKLKEITEATTLAQGKIRTQNNDVDLEEYIDNTENQKVILDGFVRKKLSQISEIENQAQIEIKNLQDAVERKYSDKEQYLAFYSSGELTKGGKKFIAKRKTEIQEKMLESIQKDIESIMHTGIDFENDLISFIKNIAPETITYSTLNSEHKNISLIVGEYDANREAWKATLHLNFNSQLPTTTQFYISYKELTGKNPPNIANTTESEADSFNTTVQFYDSLFRSNIQYIFATVTVTIKPALSPADGKITRKSNSNYDFDADLDDSKYILTISNYKIQRVPDKNDKEYEIIKTGSVNMPSHIKLSPQNGKLYHVWNTKHAYKTLHGAAPQKSHFKEARFNINADALGFLNLDGAGVGGSVGLTWNISTRNHLRLDVPFYVTPLLFKDEKSPDSASFKIGGQLQYFFTAIKNRKNTFCVDFGAGVGIATDGMKLPVSFKIPFSFRIRAKYFEAVCTTSWNFNGYFEDNIMLGATIPLGGRK